MHCEDEFGLLSPPTVEDRTSRARALGNALERERAEPNGTQFREHRFEDRLLEDAPTTARLLTRSVIHLIACGGNIWHRADHTTLFVRVLTAGLD